MPPVRPPKPGPVIHLGDPQRDRWGGAPERDGRKLEAHLVEAGKDNFFFDLIVSSTDGSELRGPVVFHLNDSYERPVQQIRRIRDKSWAVWKEIDAKKSYTVGAQVRTAAGNWVGLELDLAAMSGLPRRFVPRRARKPGRTKQATGRGGRAVKGTDLKKLQDAIVSAFSEDEFEQLLRYSLNLNLNHIAGRGPFVKRVFDTIQYVEHRGLLPDLIAAVAKERPRSDDLQALFRQFASDITSAAQQMADDVKAQEAYDKIFGRVPPVDFQKAGATEAVLSAQDPGLQRTLRKDLGFLDAAFWGRRLAETQRQVCRVELNNPPDDTLGTGFLVGPDVVLTNYHVLEKVIAGNHAPHLVRFRFDYRTATDGKVAEETQIGLDRPADPNRQWLLKFAPYSAGEAKNTPDSPPPKEGELDYALVRIARPLGSLPAGDTPRRGWVEVPGVQPPLAGLPYLMILQHPEGRTLKLAMGSDPNIELKFDGLRVRYAINTEGGSSGSPVFDKDWKLVALHHYGDPSWLKPMYNQGIPIGLIRQHLGVQAEKLLPPSGAGGQKLERASAAIAALSTALESPTPPNRAEIATIVAQTTDAVIAAAVPTPSLSDRVRNIYDKKLETADKELADAIDRSNDPRDWAKANDKYKKTICNILRAIKHVDGGMLPDDLYDLWTKHGCT